MKTFICLLLFSLFLSSCGDSGFTENYQDAVCMPANSLTIEYLEKPTQYSSTEAQTCCASSGLVSCCFGGSYICANGDTGVGCGCPSR